MELNLRPVSSAKKISQLEQNIIGQEECYLTWSKSQLPRGEAIHILNDSTIVILKAIELNLSTHFYHRNVASSINIDFHY